MQIETILKQMRFATMFAILMLVGALLLMPRAASAGTEASTQTSLPDSGSSSLSGVLRVYVPFTFTVNGKTMNPGEYYISRDGEQFVSIKDGSGKNATFVLTHNIVTADDKATTPKLIFHRYGDNYFLAQAWLSHSYAGRELSMSNAERKIARENRGLKATLEVGR